MNGTLSQITVYQFEFGRIGQTEREQLTLDGLAARAGLHPTLVERFVEYGLIEPTERAGAHMLFDVDCVARVRKVERLRRDLGANLASVAVILDLVDRLSGLEQEIERLRRLVL